VSDDLRELYQEVILDHSRNPRNNGFPPGCNRTADGHNPLCGDKIKVKLVLENDGSRERVSAIGFEGTGCAISQASASTMTEAVKGKSKEEIHEMFSRFHSLVTGHGGVDPEALGKLAVFAGVSEFPMRVKCASLPWHTLQAALAENGDPVTTE